MAGLTDKDIERMLRRTEIATSSECDAKIMALVGGGEIGARHTGGKRRLRRFSVGLAGALAVAAALAIVAFFAGPVEPASAAEVLQRAVDALKAAEWIHATTTVNGEPSGEYWCSVNPLRECEVSPDAITMRDFGKKESYEYDAVAGVLTIRSFFSGAYKALEGAESVVEAFVREFEREGAELTSGVLTEGARTLKVITAVSRSTKSRVFIEPATGKIVRIEQEMKNADGSPHVVVSHVDYPPSGPADIYALGVPRDARVVDMRAPAAAELLEAAHAARAAFDDTYFAIICHKTRQKDGSYWPGRFYLVYKSKGRYRVEYYNSSHLTRPITTERYHERLANLACEDIGVLEDELKTTKPAEIYFASDAGGSTKRLERNRSDGSLLIRDWDTLWHRTPEGVTWYQLPQGLWMVTDVERREGAFGPLAAIVETRQGIIKDGEVLSLPHRNWWCLNPERDHIVEEYVRREDGQAEWQEDKDWLEGVEGADEAKGKRSTHTYRVTEYGRTGNGKWYARKAVDNWENLATAESSGSLTLVLFDASREMPEELFDFSKVTAEDLYDSR